MLFGSLPPRRALRDVVVRRHEAEARVLVVEVLAGAEGGRVDSIEALEGVWVLEGVPSRVLGEEWQVLRFLRFVPTWRRTIHLLAACTPVIATGLHRGPHTCGGIVDALMVDFP